MDIFHDNPVLQSVRQMLGAFAKQMMRPIAIKHDQEESMPWDLLRAAQGVGMTQTAILDGRRRPSSRAVCVMPMLCAAFSRSHGIDSS